MKLPFGKYKGTHINYLPDEYLWWIFGQDFLSHDLASAIRDEAVRRCPEKFPAPIVYPAIGNTKGAVLAAIKIIFRDLALFYHPDRGGDPEAMKALNEFRERLMLAIL
jgi:hypothetical protein